MTKCPICKGKHTLQSIYDASSKKLDAKLCRKHLLELVDMLGEYMEA